MRKCGNVGAGQALTRRRSTRNLKETAPPFHSCQSPPRLTWPSPHTPETMHSSQTIRLPTPSKHESTATVPGPARRPGVRSQARQSAGRDIRRQPQAQHMQTTFVTHPEGRLRPSGMRGGGLESRRRPYRGGDRDEWLEGRGRRGWVPGGGRGRSPCGPLCWTRHLEPGAGDKRNAAVTVLALRSASTPWEGLACSQSSAPSTPGLLSLGQPLRSACMVTQHLCPASHPWIAAALRGHSWSSRTLV